MATCTYHPARSAAGSKFGRNLCQQCLNGMAGAVALVETHIVPKECFVRYRDADYWAPITGPGSAHWLAHQLDVKVGDVCPAGSSLRISDLSQLLSTEIRRARVQVGDVWIGAKLEHCGLVTSVTLQGNRNRITVRHDSSVHSGVCENDFDDYFGGTGTFRRKQ
jgi:hypothetical protein